MADYLGEAISEIPIPLRAVFAEGYFECRLSAKMLDYYVENPQRWLDEDGEKQLKAVHTVLMRKFTELAFAQSADSDQRPNRAVEGDEIDLGRVTDADLQKSLLEASDDPF